MNVFSVHEVSRLSRRPAHPPPSILWSHSVVNGTSLFSSGAYYPMHAQRSLKDRPTTHVSTWKWWVDTGGKPCVCVCVCTVGEGCLHLNWVHSHGLGGLVVFNVTIAGQNDLCGAGQHQSLNPPPPCLFQFSPSFIVKRGLWLPFLRLSLPPISLNRLLTGQGMSWGSLNLCEVAFNTEESKGM